MNKLFSALLAGLLLSACATGPGFNVREADQSVTPRSAVAKGEAVEGKTVLWGGVILNVQNLKDRTKLEVLAYPLDRNQRPDREKEPLGRFILGYAGYLEPTDYGQGRLITVLGRIGGTTQGNVGEAQYTYPLLTSGEIYLWPKNSRSETPDVHFGIGIGIGL